MKARRAAGARAQGGGRHPIAACAPLGRSALPIPKYGNANNGKANESRAENHHQGRIDTKEFTDGHCRHPHPVHPEASVIGGIDWRPRKQRARQGTRRSRRGLWDPPSGIRRPPSRNPLVVVETLPPAACAILNTPRGRSLRQAGYLVSLGCGRRFLTPALAKSDPGGMGSGRGQLSCSREDGESSARSVPPTMARRIADACELVHASTRRSAWSISADKESIDQPPGRHQMSGGRGRPFGFSSPGPNSLGLTQQGPSGSQDVLLVAAIPGVGCSQ
jgi:hypothetical protein